MAASEAWVSVEVGQVLAQSNNGQGDCLFVAISQQLEDGEATTPAALRQLAVDFLTDHRVHFENELLALGWEMVENRELPCGLEGELLIDAALQLLANPWTWGGAECIGALGLALNREIRVYQENGPTVVFPGGEESGFGIRILLRYPRSGDRRTHYESVLAWRLQSGDSASRVQAQVSVGSQTLPEVCNPSLRCEGDDSASRVQAQVSVARQTLPEVCNPSLRCDGDDSALVPPPPQREGSSMVLRRRPGLPSSHALRSEEFSDAEEYRPDQENPEEESYRRCIICHHNVGHYVLLNCGGYPVCGMCIRTWYVNIQGAPCPHCGLGVAGWSRVYNQH